MRQCRQAELVSGSLRAVAAQANEVQGSNGRASVMYSHEPRGRARARSAHGGGRCTRKLEMDIMSVGVDPHELSASLTAGPRSSSSRSQEQD